MNNFIQNHQYNIIRREMFQITKLLKYNGDQEVVEAIKARVQATIDSLFIDISGEEGDLLRMGHLMNEQEVTTYMNELEVFTRGMPPVTDGQLNKLFRKEKKFKLPEQGIRDQRHSYLGWRDEGKKRLYAVAPLGDRLLGMSCQEDSGNKKNSTMCAVCGHVNEGAEVVGVTVKCKTASPDSYHAIGFNICSDSRGCNGRITDPGKLERLLQKVAGID